MQVRFRLEAELRFSSSFTPEAEQATRALIDEANRVLFMKGVPKGVDPSEVGRIAGSPQFTDNLLALTFESGAYTRAHDALFRFRKQIAPRLGKFRLGIRDIDVGAYTVIMTGDFPEGFKVPQLPFIRHAVLTDESLIMDLAVT